MSSRPVQWLEPGVVGLLSWLALVAIPICQGNIGIGWDTINHHIYLGWTAGAPRFGQDFLAASYQSLQYPYTYWPVYKLALGGATGVQAGVVLASLQWLAVPALWLVARVLIPGSGALEACLRGLSVALGLLSPMALSLFDSTSNDLLSAVPLMWALALAMIEIDRAADRSPRIAAVLASGALAGVSVAFKLSNGPLAILLPVLWVCAGRSVRERLQNTAWGCTAAGGGFLASYGYWGWQLWQNFGNPVYPFCDACFEPVRHWMGWP